MSGNVTLASNTDSQETIERVLRESIGEEPAGEAAPPSAETATESPTVEPESEPRTSKRSQKIKRLAEKLSLAERERDEWRQKAESGGREEQPKKVASQTDPNAYPVPEPKYEDFATPAEFMKAMTRWELDAREHRRTMTERQQAQQAVVESHFDRVEDAREKYSDYDQTIANAEVFFKTEAAQNSFTITIYENEDGPEVLYYLGKHPEVAEQFAEMSPGQVAAKVGRIAASMGKTSPVVKPRPRLIEPVGGTTKVAVDRDKIDYRDWKAGRRSGAIR